MLIHGAVDNDLHPPRFGGTQRAFGLYRGLARRHEVRVLCVVPNRSPGAREETVDGVALARRKAWYTSLAWRLDAWGLAPLQSAAELHDRRTGTWLAALPGRPDVMAVEFAMSGLLGRSGARLDVYLSQNVEADFFATTSSRLALGGWWRGRVRDRERRAVQAAHLTIAVSDEDAARMIALHGAEPSRVEVIPNGFDETRLHAPTAVERERARASLGLGARDYVAVFVGSDVAHNREAVRLLVERVGPAIAGRGVVIVIAGRVSGAVAGAREPWLRVLGEVPEITPVLHAADAGLNPVLRGGGSNVKLPTYLAAGLAVVSTPFGTRGYASLAPMATTAEPAAFADALLARPAGWAARGEIPPAAVAAHSWGALGERLGERFGARLAAPAATAGPAAIRGGAA